MKEIKTHEEEKHIIECIIIPKHNERKESYQFRQSKKRLKEDGHYYCYICGISKKLQVHHYVCEWSLEKEVDFDKLKSFCEEWDVYGYGKLLKNTPITSVDDVRNCMVLCQKHHTGVNVTNENSGVGVHSLTFSAWIMQKISKQGYNPIPQDGETSNQLLEAIDKKLD